jgi:hypothetical protein
MNETLDAILGVVPDDDETSGLPAVVEAEVVGPPAVPVSDDVAVDSDFEHSRTVIREAIDAVRPALDNAIVLAQAGDSPRAYEVVGKMLESIVNASRELIDIHNVRKTAKSPNVGVITPNPGGAGGTVNIQQAVFTGRASDLIREVRKLSRKAEEDETIDTSSSIDEDTK